MGNGKITKELKGLGLKVNEKEPNGETVSEVIKGIADDYTGGGSGATYTAGNGINITKENVINADIKVLEVSNITGLTTEQCESLNVGDVIVKLTSNQKHTYTVSYKEAGVGMCLTYVDASTSETVSYDYTGGQWVYNSTDITPLKNVVANPTLAGTEDNLTGLQVGETKYKVPSGGSGINVIDFNGIIKDDFNEGFYNNIISLYNENNPTFIKNVSSLNLPTITGLISVMVSNVVTVYEEEDHDAITFYFMYESNTYEIQVLDNDYVRVFEYTLVEEPYE